jgi:hypothetical protein
MANIVGQKPSKQGFFMVRVLEFFVANHSQSKFYCGQD